ncbi:MAG: hypothetical protein ACTSR2_13335, partial [Candidatus Hodarchaeales archaeon]
GMVNYSAKELEKIVAQGKKKDIKVIGILSFSDNVTSELIERSIDKISLAGILRAPKNVLPVINSKRYTILGRKYDDFCQLDQGSDSSNVDSKNEE